MKRNTLACLLAALLAAEADGAPRAKSSCATVLHNGAVVAVDAFGNQVAITPFATAIGVPVATVTPGAAFYQSGHDLSGIAAELSALRAELAAIKNQGVGAMAKQTAVGSKCASCHSGESAKKHFRVDVPMSDDARLKAIGMVLAGKMPPRTPLNPQAAGEVLTELSSRPSAKTQDVPPPAEPK